MLFLLPTVFQIEMGSSPIFYSVKKNQKHESVSGILVRKAELDLHFFFGKNNCLAAIELATSRCPGDICIWMGSSPADYKTKKDTPLGVSFLLVRKAGLEPACPE